MGADVTPSNHDRRWTDVTRLTFTPQIVAAIVVTALSVFGAMWASQSGLRSDVRDILTRMDSEAQLAEVNSKLMQERSETLGKAIEAMQRRQELQAYELQAMKESILTLKGR